MVEIGTPRPFVKWLREQEEDEDKVAWQTQCLTHSDTVCTTGFAASSSKADLLLGKADLATFKSWLAPGVFDADSNAFRVDDNELEDLMAGVLHTRGRWRHVMEPNAAIGQLHTTLQGEFSSPYVSDFQVQIIINQEDAATPDKFLCTGVLSPEGQTVALTASFDGKTLLTLTGPDGFSVVETFDAEYSKFADMLRRGRIVSVKDLVAPYVEADKVRESILDSAAADQDKLDYVHRLMARGKVKEMGGVVRQLVDAESEHDHYERWRLLDALDHLRLAGKAPPVDVPANLVVSLDDETLARIGDAIKANGPVPDGTGPRAAWLIKMGWIKSANLPRGKKDRARFLDMAHREYCAWQLTQMRNPGHRHHHNHNKWRKRLHLVDVLTKLIHEEPPREREEAPAPAEDASLSLLQQQAEGEVDDAVDELPPEAPNDEEEYKSDYEELQEKLQQYPEAVPRLLRPPPAEEDDYELVEAVDKKKALEQRLAITKSRKRRGKGKKNV